MDPTMVSKYSFANATIGFTTQDNPTIDTHIWTLVLSTSHPGSSRTTPMTTHQVPKSMFKFLRSTFDGVPLNNSAICFILRKLTICMNSQQNIEWGHEVKWPLKLQVWPQLEVKNWDATKYSTNSITYVGCIPCKNQVFQNCAIGALISFHDQT